MSPALRVPAAFFLFASTVALSGTQLSCGSDQSTPTSGGAHYELQSFAGATDPALKCSDIGFKQDVATPDGKLVVDGADQATVNCNFDDKHFNITVVTQSKGAVSASGTIVGGTSTDASVSINVLGTTYTNPASTKCTVTFVCPDSKGCDPGTKFPSGNSIEGHFICQEVDNARTAQECAIIGANPAGLSNSYFKFNDCNG